MVARGAGAGAGKGGVEGAARAAAAAMARHGRVEHGAEGGRKHAHMHETHARTRAHALTGGGPVWIRLRIPGTHTGRRAGF